MIYIDNNETNPYFNLASEEYLLKHREEEFFMLWRNEDCIVVGKHQNTLSEINYDYVLKNNIPVIRRLTGGGAVFHDLGNLNFTFIVNDCNKFNDYKGFLFPIQQVLKDLGIEAVFSGRNDLMIEDKKISGNAECIYNDRVLHHGTLLFSSNKSRISDALKISKVKYKDKAVKSVASRITNIKEYLNYDISVEEFKKLIFKKILLNNEMVQNGFDYDEINRIKVIEKNIYSNKQWNFGESPKYNFKNEVRFKGGTIQIYMEVFEGIINDIKIYGDYFGKDIDHLENIIKGNFHDKIELYKVLSLINIDDYIIGLDLDSFINSLF